MTTVTRLHATTEPGRLVNCWVIDVGEGLVTVDSSLLPSDARRHRARIDAMNKPVLAGLVTHGHPDHVVGLGTLLDGLDVPVYAIAGATDVMRAYEQTYLGRAAELPPQERVEHWRYPDTELRHDQVLHFGDTTLRVEDIGSGGDCRANSIFWLEAAEPAVFTADLALRTHPWLFDGGLVSWLANLHRLLPLVQQVGRVHPGHLDSTGAEVLVEQRDYLLTYAAEVKALGAGASTLAGEAKAELERRMIEHYPGFPLRELIVPGADVVAGQL